MVKAYPHSRSAAGFSLVELLVSIAIVAILLVVLTQITDGVRRITSNSRQDVKEFQQARNAFEVMTRRIGQATLNSYNDVNPGPPPGLYTRASELRFITGNAGTTQTISATTVPALLPTALQANTTTDAIFFQAPLGRFSPGTASATYQQLANALNTCGYFIEYTSDADPNLHLRPNFLGTGNPKWRYRLIELMEPADQLQIYNYTSGPDTTTPTQTKSWNYTLAGASATWQNWYWDGLGAGDSTSTWSPASPGATATTPPYVHVLADNIIYLAILPMVAPRDALNPFVGGDQDGTSTDIAPNYFYDSSQQILGSPVTPTPDYFNRLPPMVYVQMVAVDEGSWVRFQSVIGGTASTPPISTLGLSGILKTTATYANRNGTTELGQVTGKLRQYHISYQIFSAVIPISSR